MTLRDPLRQLDAAILSLADPVVGIVPSVFDVEMNRYDPSVFVTAANGPKLSAAGTPSVGGIEGSGAGLTWQGAWMAAVGEVVERYALSNVHPEDVLLGSSSLMRKSGHDPVDGRDWTLFHASQYKDVPFAPLDDDTPIAWTPAQSITHRRDRLVPACLAYLPYRPLFIEQGERLASVAVSTGAACAASYPDALLGGVCEQIERDAFMIFWRSRLPCPRVSIDSGSALHDIFHERFARPGLHYTLIYTTLDLAIPSFFGILIDARTVPPGIVVGGAAHPDPGRAVLKTLLELVQGLKWREYEGLYHSPHQAISFDEVRSFKDRARLYAFSDMRTALDFAIGQAEELPLSAIASHDLGEARRNLHLCVQLLAKRGLETIALDLTSPDIQAAGLCVTRVLVPGCEVMEGDHHLPQLGGLRWREVPYELGLTAARPDLGTLNSIPHPYP